MWFKSGKRILIIGCSKVGTGKLAKQLALGADAEFMPTAVRFGAVPGQVPSAQMQQVQNYKVANLGLVAQAIVYPQHCDDYLTELADFCRSFDQVVWVHRDPRDRLISHLLFKWARAPKLKIRKGRIDEWHQSYQTFKEALTRKLEAPSEVAVTELMGDNALKQSEKRAYQNLERVLELLGEIDHFKEVRVEDLFATSVTPLIESLGLTVVTQAHLESFEGNDWRHWFTQSDIVTFNPIYRNYIAKQGYETAYNLFDEPYLTPAQSTDYVERLFRGANRRLSQQMKRISDTH